MTKKVNVWRYQCGGYYTVRYSEVKNDVIGYGGTVWESTDSAGCAAEFFACSQACLGTAIERALRQAWED